MGIIISCILFQNRLQVVAAVYQHLVAAEKEISANNNDFEIMQINQNTELDQLVLAHCFC